jgi:two-component system NtrC family sensor kinase
MSDSVQADARIRQYSPIVATASWPVALLDVQGTILAASASAWELLGEPEVPPQAASLPPYLVTTGREQLPAMLAEAVAASEPTSATLQLVRGTGSQTVEVELWPMPALGPAVVSMLLYQQSAADRRNQLLLACNLLGPRLLRAESREAVYRQVGDTMHKLGFGMSIFELNRANDTLRIVHDTSVPEVYELLGSVVQPAPGDGSMPASIAILGDVLTSRRALYHPNPTPMLEQLFAPEAVAAIRQIQNISGVRGFFYAPLIVEDSVHGIFNVWGPNLDYGDVPFIEAFAHQIGAALGQIALRHAMERQIERLSALATTAQAVTNLGALDDVLELICRQACKLLGADSSSLVLPTAAGDELEISTAVGGREGRVGMRLPIDASLFGLVFRSGVGLLSGDTHIDPRVYAPALQNNPIHAVIFQPLIHHGTVLGVLDVGHREIDFFSEADLDYLGRYAEYAALAIVNARLYRESEATHRYLDTIIQNVPDGMLMVRPDTTMRPLNASPVHSLADRRTNLEGRSFLDLVPPESHEAALEHWRAALGGEARRFEIELLRVSGERYTAFVSLNKIPGYGEVLATVRDITELRRLESDVRQSEKLAALGRMVAGAAHELNNPLAVILGLTQLQLEEPLPPASHHDLQGIERAALRAAAIIEQLRLFAHPQPHVPQSVDLCELAETALDGLRAQVDAAGAHLVREYATEPLLVAGEPRQLEQILVNLLQNAIQAVASNPPGAARTITLHGRCVDGFVQFTISDSGPGISAAHKERLFEPFFTTRDVGQGLGLGLALSHALVQQHGGTLRVVSEPEQGAVFELLLRSDESRRPPEPAPPATIPAGTRVLLAEDEALVRLVAERALRRNGCVVDAVGSAEEALALASTAEYDLVVSDIQMPGVDGRTFHARLSALRPELRWLMITGDTMGEQSRDFLARTGLSVLPKPFTTTELVRCVVASIAKEAKEENNAD